MEVLLYLLLICFGAFWLLVGLLSLREIKEQKRRRKDIRTYGPGYNQNGRHP